MLNAAVPQDCPGQKTFLFTVEKRYIFTLNDLDIRAQAFEYFIEHLREALTAMETDDEKKCSNFKRKSELRTSLTVRESHHLFSEEKLQQHFCYERTKDMTLVQIEIKRVLHHT